VDSNDLKMYNSNSKLIKEIKNTMNLDEILTEYAVELSIHQNASTTVKRLIELVLEKDFDIVNVKEEYPEYFL